ncbi:hypothetical protein [Fictibacillus solisalsi]|uniref:hypothetical protein n=1 Tax=Fictibacillus solisalsi TaxID=459525 RepID=UPI000B7F77B8|nr:hypothetical protein [Fictibacillus solisalsi]
MELILDIMRSASHPKTYSITTHIPSFTAHLPDDIPISCFYVSYKVQAVIQAGKGRARFHFLTVCINYCWFFML